jgi:hypothetical protein
MQTTLCIYTPTATSYIVTIRKRKAYTFARTHAHNAHARTHLANYYDLQFNNYSNQQCLSCMPWIIRITNYG